MNAKLLAAAAVFTMSVTAQAQSSFSPRIENLLVETCTQAQEDDRVGLHHTLKANRLSKQNAVDKVVCNGKPLVSFARSANANKVVAMLAPFERRTKGKVAISDVVAP